GPLCAERTDGVSERYLVIEPSVANRNRRLVREDCRKLSLARRRELGGDGIDEQNADNAFVVLEREIESAHGAVALEVDAEDLNESSLRIRSGVWTFGQIKSFAKAGGPRGAHREILEGGVLRVDAVSAGNGANVTY